MDKQFTPGPWLMEDNGQSAKGVWIGKDEANWSALSCGKTNEEAIANARLIAAAPEMFELLEFLAQGQILDIQITEKIKQLLTRITTP